MTNRSLGIIAMICAPFLGIDFFIHGQNGPQEQFEHSSLSGLFCLIYMIGWTCSIIVMRRTKATGDRAFEKSLLVIQLCTLTLANIWNIYEIISPDANTTVYQILDMFWPISNVMLFIIGIAAVFARKLQGWKRFIPLMAGAWLPVSILLMILIGQNFATMILSGFYSAITWTLLGYLAFSARSYAVEVKEPATHTKLSITLSPGK